MSQPNAADRFVPLDPTPASPGNPVEPAPSLRVVPKTANTPVFTPLDVREGHPHPPARSGQPVVILQRDADRVTGIRIECACGQVIELACDYDKQGMRDA
jgi:hypothetical protein